MYSTRMRRLLRRVSSCEVRLGIEEENYTAIIVELQDYNVLIWYRTWSGQTEGSILLSRK